MSSNLTPTAKILGYNLKVNNKKYGTIIFDFFGVISSEVAPVWLRRYFSEKDIVELRKTYIEPADRGDISENQLFDVLSKISSLPPERIRDEWLALAIVRVDMVEFIKKLSGKYKLAILSDTPSLFFREIISENKLEKLFDKIIVSSEIHATKENLDTYKIVLKELDALPKETIFIDDNPANVGRARSLGIEGLVFSNQPKLEKDLSSMGISA